MKNLINQIMNFKKNKKLNKNVNKKNIEKNEIEKKNSTNNNAMIFAKTKIANKIIRIEIEIEKTISIEKNEIKIMQIIIILISNLLLTTFSNNLIIFFDKQIEIKNKKNCYICEKTNYRKNDCSKKFRNKNKINVESSKN